MSRILAWACGFAALAACQRSSKHVSGAPVLEVSPAQVATALGTSRHFSAIATFADGNAVDWTDDVLWTTSDPLVADVDPGAGSNSTFMGLAIGSALIVASDPQTGASAAALLEVTAAELVSLELTPPAASVPWGLALPFQATGIYTDGSTQDLTALVSWECVDGLVAGFPKPPGLVVGIAPGTTQVAAVELDSGIGAAAQLEVTDAVVVALELAPAQESIALGTTQTFVATGQLSNSLWLDLTALVDWSSSDPAVASFPGAPGLARGDALGSTIIQAHEPVSGVSGAAALEVTAAELVSVELAPTNPSIALGTQQTFAATGIYTDATTQDLTAGASWSSSDPLVAAFGGASGVASSQGLGTTTITALDAGSGISGTTELEVTDAELVALEISPADPTIPLGLQQAFTATGVYTDATTQDLTDQVTWASSDAAVATLSNAPGSKGLATSAAVGGTTVSVTDPGTGVSATTGLVVSAAELVSLSITPADPSIPLGLQQAFSATGTYTDASTQDLTANVAWSSSDGGVAGVSNAPGSAGLASSVSIGSVLVSALEPGSGIAASTTLTVTAAELVSIGLAPADPSIPLGLQQAFTATGTYTDASTQDLTGVVTWSSSAPAVATISNASGSQGLATSVASGNAQITALEPASGTTAVTTLTVSPAALAALAIAPANPTIALGLQQSFTATGTYTDATTQDLTGAVAWSSSDSGVATISNAPGTEGVATSAASGSTTLTALHGPSGISDTTVLTVAPPVAFVASAQAAGTTTLVTPTPAGTLAGHVMIATIAIRPSSAVITAPAGWTLIRELSNGTSPTNKLALYWRLAATGEPASHSWTFSTSTGSCGGILSFENVDAADPVAAEDGANTAFSLTHTTPSATTTTPHALVVASFSLSSSANWTPPAGMSEQVDVYSLASTGPTGISCSAALQTQVAAGATGVKSAVAGNDADIGNAHILVLRRAALP